MRSGSYIIIIGLTLLSTSFAYCQETKSDTSFLEQSKMNSIALYTASFQNQSRLYNGGDYIIYMPHDEEHPYYKSDDWSYGSIVYWGELYENVPLLYDLSIDQAITEQNRGNAIRLVGEKVESFTIFGHNFIRLRRDEKNKISDGFYDRLYDGNSKVYAKYFKSYQQTMESTKVIPRFDESKKYYLVKDGTFYVVKTKASILQVFDNHKQEVKNFIRKNRIRFKANRERAIAQVAEFYDTLKD